MRQNLCRLLAIAVVGMLGATAFAEQIDNPQYTAWAKFKAGTTVTTKSETSMKMAGNENKTSTTMTTKLSEITPTEATVETTMESNGTSTPLPARKIPAKIDKPADNTAAAPKADVKEGTDKVEVAGKSYNAKTTETTSEANGNKTVSKTWMSDEIPGGMAKMESSTSGAMEMKTTMTVTDIKTP